MNNDFSLFTSFPAACKINNDIVITITTVAIEEKRRRFAAELVEGL